MTWLRILGRWFDSRLKVSESILPMLMHPIPRGAAGPMGWWYIFGSASLTLLLVQILTGIGLAMVYVPSADSAYASLLSLDYDHPLGWFLRALHYYAGSGMVVMVRVASAGRSHCRGTLFCAVSRPSHRAKRVLTVNGLRSAREVREQNPIPQMGCTLRHVVRPSFLRANSRGPLRTIEHY